METFTKEFATALAAIIMATIAIVGDKVLSFFKKRKEPGAQTFEKTWILNEELYPIMWGLLVEYEAIRVFIIQFHNGDKFYSGQSIQKMTCSHEVKKPREKGVKQSIIGVPVDGETHNILSKIRSEEIYEVEDAGTVQDIDLKERFSYLGVKSKYCFGIHDSSGRIVGVLYMHFGRKGGLENAHGPRMTVSEISSLLNKHTTKT